jgi:hypothetical protein
MFKSFIMIMNLAEILNYYSRPEIQNAILNFSKEREVVGSLKDGSYLSRPDTLLYPKDVMEKVKKGVVAFHCSVEKWFNPMQLSTNLSQNEMDNLRKSFDFIIDIDAKVKLEHAIVAAEVVYKFLKELGVEATVKFSGRRGVHIGVAAEAFPDVIDFKKTSSRYPEVPQALAEFIVEKSREQILEGLIAEEGGVASLVKCLPSISELSPYAFIDIEKGWGNRHLFRMPYSLHPKQWLVSVPLKIEELKNFNPEDANPEKIKTDVEFLVNKEGEATELLLQALDWKSKQPKEVVKEVRIVQKSKKLVLEDMFPPCMKLILSGLSDGKKRSLFTLIAFLRNMNWKQEDVEKRIREWNMKNSTPLPDRFIKTQLKWHFRQNRNLMTANCTSELFYDNIGVCKPDRICDLKNIKNPVNYPFRLMRKNNNKIN